MPRLLAFAAFALLAVLVADPTGAAQEKATPEQVAFFEKKIRPVLVDQCYACHSADAEKLRAGLMLDTRAGIRKGGDTGPAVVPGDPAKSLLIRAVKSKDASTQMPPKKPLSEAVIADLEAWVRMGAPDPRDGSAKAKGEIDIAEGRKFWAFQVPKASSPPVVKDAAWPKTDVDRFVLAGLEAKGLKPVADADTRTLVRRVYLDLIGLPPSAEQANRFANDTSANALEKLIDTLLASPAFGERWGRHWLDVARYAESTGKAVNFNFPHAWRYRDYVIAAYNADKPFDLFVKEQLAGDLIPAKDDADKAENIVALGFLALGTKAINERNRTQFELDLADEQIDAFSQAFLGMTAACARCHDHKFDPIPTRDYYALAGIFRSTETCYGTIRSIQSANPTPLVSLPAGAHPAHGTPPLGDAERTRIDNQLKSLKGELAELSKKSGERESFLAANGVRTRIQIGMLEAKLDLFEKDGTPKTLAMSAREKSRAKDSPVYARGETDKPGAVVPRGVLQVVGTAPKITSGSGRLELANWVASAENPLTSRVYVNRVWKHLFGRGLVATVDNFGTTGLPPSNPALLDSLAVQFAKHGRTKKLVKDLMLSHAYRLSTKFDGANHEADPDNALLWRMTPGRLDAEAIRDSLLAVSGNLNATPPKGSPIAAAGDGYSIARGRPQGPFGGAKEDETHRSVYLPIVRDNLPESLSLFDAADANVVSGERANTTVPAQALFLMNNPFVLKQSEAAAERLLKNAKSDAELVKLAYAEFYGRPPTDEELNRAESFATKYAAGKKSQKATWSAFCQALFASAEFLMRN